MLDALKKDFARYSKKKGNLFLFFLKALQDCGFRAMVLYRLGHWCRQHHLGLLAGLCERLMRHLCLCWIGTRAQIGGGLKIAHGIGLVIGGGTIIGQNCDVRQNTTFGGNYSKTDAQGRELPVLGDNVSVGAGAVILGPVHVGDNAIIGANAVVVDDVPANMIVGGVPARVIKQRWDESSGRKY